MRLSLVKLEGVKSAAGAAMAAEGGEVSLLVVARVAVGIPAEGSRFNYSREGGDDVPR